MAYDSRTTRSTSQMVEENLRNMLEGGDHKWRD